MVADPMKCSVADFHPGEMSTLPYLVRFGSCMDRFSPEIGGRGTRVDLGVDGSGGSSIVTSHFVLNQHTILDYNVLWNFLFHDVKMF